MFRFMCCMTHNSNKNIQNEISYQCFQSEEKGFSDLSAICDFFYLSFLPSSRLFDNELTGACCPHLMQALMSEHCSLSELDLSVNDLGQEGALLLCQALSRPGCPVEKLG